MNLVCSGYDRQRLEELQSRMMKSISMETLEERLFEELLHLFGTVNGEEDGEEKTDIEEILAYIDEHYLTIESMEEVAEEFGYNYTYLSRMFKNEVGLSPSEYREQEAAAREITEE